MKCLLDSLDRICRQPCNISGLQTWDLQPSPCYYLSLVGEDGGQILAHSHCNPFSSIPLPVGRYRKLNPTTPEKGKYSFPSFWRYSMKSQWLDYSLFYILDLTLWRREKLSSNRNFLGTSLVVQWLRIHLPIQGTRVQALVRKIPHAAEQLSLCTTATEPAL